MPTKPDILCVGLTPAVQRTMRFTALQVGEVNRVRELTLTASGKGVNVARVLRTLGAHPVILGFLGGASGEFVREFIGHEGLDACWIESPFATRNCHTLLDDTTRQTTELVEEAGGPGPAEWNALRNSFTERLTQSGFVTISGALPPALPANAYAELVQAAAAHNVPCLLDSQKAPLRATLPHKPFMVKLNVTELAATVERSLSTDADIIAAARELVRQGAQHVVVTQGPNAVWLVNASETVRFTPPVVHAVNPIGSGDAVTAGIAHGLATELPLRNAVALGIACGTANALTPTPGVLLMDDLKRLQPEVHHVQI